MVKARLIEKYITKEADTKNPNGEMVPLWKDYIEDTKITPRFVYYSTILPGTKKGPYQHTKRRGLLCIISGTLLFVYKDIKEEKFIEIKADADKKPLMLDIPINTQYCLYSLDNSLCRIINICDYAWRPDDNETIVPEFKYDFKEYIKNNQDENKVENDK